MTLAFCRCFSTVLLLAAPCISAPQPSVNRGTCALTLFIVTAFGIEVPYHVSSFVSEATGREWVSRFSGLQARSIPCEEYTYILNRTDVQARTAQLKGHVRVAYSEQWVTIETGGEVIVSGQTELSVDRGGVATGLIFGEVVSPPSRGEQLWVKIHSFLARRVRVLQ